MTNTKVNSETCRADLVIGQEAKTPDDIGDIFLKGLIRIFSGRGAIIQAAILGEIQETLENAWPRRCRPAKIDVARIEGRKDLAADAGASKEYVEAPLATFAIDRAE